MDRLQLCILYISASYVSAATVRTQLGVIEGGRYVTSAGKTVYTFVGVPYSQPPIGENRFEEPKPLKPWSGVWQAKEQRPPCAQLNTFIADNPQINGDENCLYLSVYTPNTMNMSKLSVLVYFHGGAFMYGSGSSKKPDFLLQQFDFVFITVNYRLGPFGFLSTQDSVVPGNNGLKDQVLALKWVQENVYAFGGNKDSVTISGNSAGGASVHYHFLSPFSRGLFQRGISSSGSSLMPWAFTEEPLQKAKRLANALECKTDSTAEMVNCLKLKPSRDILMKIQPLFMPWLSNPFTPFGPVVENTTKPGFLNKHPYSLLRSGAIYHVPWLASTTTQEGLYPAASFVSRKEYLEELNTNWLGIAPHLLDYNFTIPENKKNSTSDKIKKFYLKNRAITTATVDNVVEMVGDRLYKVDMDFALRIQASVSPFPVYFLTFGYRGEFSISDVWSQAQNDYGVSHYDDILYVLSQVNLVNITSASDIAMVNTMTQIWTSFIKNGRPTVGNNVQWYPVRRDSKLSGTVNYLFINRYSEMYMKTDSNYGNKRFWTSLGFEENKFYK